VVSPQVTLIIPYYNQPMMLAEQLYNWQRYSLDAQAAISLCIVDDGSSYSALQLIDELHFRLVLSVYGAGVYRIKEDIPWNRGEARNIGAKHAPTKWILQTDIDHTLPPAQADLLVRAMDFMDERDWYRFNRWRVGSADETRRKDALDESCMYGQIKPHIDSYLCTTDRYWQAGGYNEDFSGCLGGGSPFLKFMDELGLPKLLPLHLEVHTMAHVPDASAHLDRTPGEYTRRRKELEKAGKLKGHDPFRIPYERIL
jgi:glycosyltransferase involved in cell wall biosynthesis